SCKQLFSKYPNLLHTTSVIKHPVFFKGRNYTGHTPEIEQSSLLTQYAYKEFPNEIGQIKSHPLLVPLGKSVEKVFKKLMNQGDITESTCLFGFPHPSGANGHRKKQ